MPTHKIGSGTRNFPVNAPVDWLAELGKAAMSAGVSLGQYWRELAELGVAQKDPVLAARLREIRRQYYGEALALLVVMLTVQAMFSHDDHTLRRGRTRARVTSRSASGRFESEEQLG